MLRDLPTAQRIEEAFETVEDRPPSDLAEWFSMCRYLPEDLMLDALAKLDSELADRHRELGSGKAEILRDVRSRLAVEEKNVAADMLS